MKQHLANLTGNPRHRTAAPNRPTWLLGGRWQLELKAGEYPLPEPLLPLEPRESLLLFELRLLLELRELDLKDLRPFFPFISFFPFLCLRLSLWRPPDSASDAAGLVAYPYGGNGNFLRDHISLELKNLHIWLTLLPPVLL